MTIHLLRLPAAVLSTICLGLALAIVALSVSAAGELARRVTPRAASVAPAGHVQLPLQFVSGLDPAALAGEWTAHGPAGALTFGADLVALELPAAEGLRPATLRVRFAGADGRTSVVGAGRQSGVVNAYIGADPTSWRQNLPAYPGIVYQSLYPGIDLHYDGNDGALKGTYVVAPQASPAQIVWRYEGAASTTIDAQTGDLQIALSDGRTLVEHAPIAWQDIAGQRIPVEVRYTLLDDQRPTVTVQTFKRSTFIGFALGAYDPAHLLTIDPTLSYGTFLGATSDDTARAIAVDGAGNVIVTGATYSTTFPSQSGARQDTNVFVTKLNQSGNELIYSTILGGAQSEEGLAITADAAGNVWVTGETRSSDFPLRNPIQGSYRLGDDTFAAKLDPAGNVLAATYLGDESEDRGNAIAVDSGGNAYIAGEAGAQFGPVAFVRKLAADGGSEIYQGYFGEAKRGFLKGTSALGIAVDSAGRAHVVGKTNTYDFPEVNALYPGCTDDGAGDCADDQAFLTIISADGTSIEFSTYLGGTRGDEARGVALDAAGNIYVTGQTTSADFPTGGPNVTPKRGPDNFSDAFVAKFTPLGAGLAYATFFGGEAWDEANAVAVDQDGGAYIVGLTSSGDLPIVGEPAQGAIDGTCIVGSTERYCYDAFVAHFGPSGALTWSSYLGGASDDLAYGVAVDASGSIYVAGRAESSGFPSTAESLQPRKAAADDAFVVKFVAGADTGNPSTPVKPQVYVPLVEK